MLEKKEIMKLNEEEQKRKNKKKKKRKKVEIEEPKKKKKKKKKVNPIIYKIIAFLLIVMTVVTFSYTIIEEVFDLYTLIPYALGFTVLVVLLTVFLTSKLRNWIKNFFSFIVFLIIIFEVLFMIYGVKTFQFLNTITDTGLRVETYGIYVKKDSMYRNISNLDNASLTYLYFQNDLVSKKTLEQAMEELELDFQIDTKDTLEALLKSINNGDTDAIFMNTSFDSVAKEEYPEMFNNLTCIYTIDKVKKITTNNGNKNLTKETFAVYLSGIDTSGRVASSARSDVNIVAIINPITHQILLINTPRDYYVELASNSKYDKLTHAGLTSIEESSNTLANLYGIEIDYYARINFTSFIKIINALEGITVDVKKSFCEQDSNRNFDNQICLNKGVQRLNGEQALAYARHRKTLAQGDISRGENQMQIIEAMAKKAMSPTIIKKYSEVINALSGNMLTNMDTDTMYALAKYQVSKNPNWTIHMINAGGTTASKPCYALGNAYASVVVPDESSIERVKQSIENLYADKTDIVVLEEVTEN